MRRSLGGLFLLVAGALFALSISLFWLDQVAFSPAADTDTAFAVMGDTEIRDQVATLVASIDGPVLGMSPAPVRDVIAQNMQIPEGAAAMREVVAAAHARVIGDRDDPVQISAAEQVQIVLNENVALQPPITLPVEEVGAISILNTAVGWMWLVGFPLAIVAMLAGLFVRPERGEFAFAFGLGCASTGVLLAVFGYLVPATMLAPLSSDVWTGVFPRLANKDRGLTLVGVVFFAAIGALTVFGTSGLRQRRQRSTPLAVGRYREQQRWGR